MSNADPPAAEEELNEGDNNLSEMTPADYARVMAEGLGDFEWSELPNRVRTSQFVESLDIPFPQWDPQFLAKVQATLGTNADEFVRWAMDDPEVRDGELSPDEGQDLEALFDRLGGHVEEVSVAPQGRRHWRARRRART